MNCIMAGEKGNMVMIFIGNDGVGGIFFFNKYETNRVIIE